MHLGKTLTMALLALGCHAAASAQPLPSYKVDLNKVFVAGISSGGYMAVQMHVAYSSTFKGAAIYAGGPYDCAQNSLTTALSSCLGNDPAINTAALIANAQNWAQQGHIDPVTNLKNQPVYLWSGKLDTFVRQPVMDALRNFYIALGANVFQYDNSFLAGHGWESPSGTEPCAKATKPYNLLCSVSDNPASTIPASNPATGTAYDSEKVWLTRLLGPLHAANTGTLRGQLLPFSQDAFAPAGSAASISMGPDGYLYVPRDCAAGATCGLLLTLHGCVQSYTSIGAKFIDTAGVNRWADTNHLIVLYPQTIATAPTGSNPQGCWDWWGYLGNPVYAQKTGPQMRALYAMIQQLAEHTSPANASMTGH